MFLCDICELMLQGRRFQGPDGEVHAAIKIQSKFKAYKQRKSYLEYRHRKWAAGVIALTWVMNVKMATMKRQLKVTRARELTNFKERMKVRKLLCSDLNRS